jgi:hypothetical protein
MPYYEFKTKDILRNTLKTHPEYKFNIYSGTIYLNNQYNISGAYVDNVTMVPTGYISLYELNIDRASDNTIYPFVTKDGSLISIGTVPNFTTNFQYGDIISSSYPMSASITRERFPADHGEETSYAASHILALKNTLNYYTYLSPHYAYSSSLGEKRLQEVNLVSIPSIFFDSGIKPGSVDLKFYITGTMVAQAKDTNKNGNLIQVDGTTFAQANGSNKVAGVVLYNEGFIVLTGSWNLTPDGYNFGYSAVPGPVSRQAQWCDFAAGANDNSDSSLTVSASFQVEFKGTNEISTITMDAIAPKGQLNHSMNPTFKLYESASLPTTMNSYIFSENAGIPIKNTISSSFCNFSASFAKQTFISKIGIYDDKRNLIAVAKLATPVKKTEDRALTFKLKLDI